MVDQAGKREKERRAATGRCRGPDFHETSFLGSNAPSVYNTICFPSLFLPSTIEDSLQGDSSLFLPSSSLCSSTTLFSLSRTRLSLLFHLLHLFASFASTAAISTIVLRLSAVSSLVAHHRHVCILAVIQSLVCPSRSFFLDAHPDQRNRREP